MPISTENVPPKVLVFSSSEGLEVAQHVRDNLGADAEAALWNDGGVFVPGENFLRSLLRGLQLHDFAVLVLTPDDVIQTRGQLRTAARDNLTFEGGLSIGRLGIRRTLILKERSVQLPSDLDGITTLSYERSSQGDPEAYTRTVTDACDQMRRRLLEQNIHHLGYVPSVALALGYHKNFIGEMLRSLESARSSGTVEFATRKKEPDWRQEEIRDFSFTILLPERLSDLGRDNLDTFVHDELADFVVRAGGERRRPFPCYVRKGAQGPDGDGVIAVYDIPTTLRVLRDCIEMIDPMPEAVGDPESRRRIEAGEVRSFKRALQYFVEARNRQSARRLHFSSWDDLDAG